MATDFEKDVIRKLAHEVAEIAALPIQEEKRRLWRKLNGLRPERPMVMADQVCWNEMDVDGELTLLCSDRECRGYEDHLRKLIYQWRHFPVDMVVEPFIRVGMAVSGNNFGMGVSENIAVGDPTNSVVGHMYNNQFEKDEDIEKLKKPVIRHDKAETGRRLDFARDLFDGILEVRPEGVNQYLSVWDPISTWMGVENTCLALVDRPEFMHALTKRVVDGYMSMLDQFEEMGVLCHGQSTIHCTGAYTDELPKEGFDPSRPRTKDIWMHTQAQMFSTVSPPMFKEFEVDYNMPLFERFGLVYYGCCDPLDLKMREVRMIPHCRKVSMSPWVNEDRGASEIGGDYVYSRKPNPAFLADDVFDGEHVRKDLMATKEVCARYGCPLELILKDISTVRYQPQRLWDWSRIALEVAMG